MSSPFAEQILHSFDGSAAISSKVFSPDRYKTLERIFADAKSFSAQGAGLSYAPLSFGGSNQAVLDMRQWNSFLQFDLQTGVVEVEAGMTLGKLAEFSVPQGWYLKVQPGHPSITVGGCLASDVHGKNQFQDGNFKNQVTFLRLYHPTKGYLYADRNENSELFDLTCGGYGLTGVVLSVGLQLGKLVSNEIETETIEIQNISDLPAMLAERSLKDDLLYSWHDLNTKKNWGHGFLVTGKNRPSSKPEKIGDSFQFKNSKLRSEDRGLVSANLMNAPVVQAMNLFYYQKQTGGAAKKSQALLEFLFPVLNKTIYFDLFGTKGFHETQVLVPSPKFSDMMKELEKKRFEFDLPITLASAKLFKGQAELLRFNGDGIVMALNFPRNQESLRFLKWWDSLVVDMGALPNLSKDSRLPLEIVEKCYPQYGLFKEKLLRWDPERLFQTALSERLHL